MSHPCCSVRGSDTLRRQALQVAGRRMAGGAFRLECGRPGGGIADDDGCRTLTRGVVAVDRERVQERRQVRDLIVGHRELRHAPIGAAGSARPVRSARRSCRRARPPSAAGSGRSRRRECRRHGRTRSWCCRCSGRARWPPDRQARAPGRRRCRRRRSGRRPPAGGCCGADCERAQDRPEQ